MSAAGSLSAGLVVLHAWGWHGVLLAAMPPIAIAVITLAVVRPVAGQAPSRRQRLQRAQ